jgi:polyisoprenoid-binding protein YceI
MTRTLPLLAGSLPAGRCRPLVALLQAAGRCRPLVALLLAAAAAPAWAQSARYEIDPEHFSVGFLVDHIGYAKVLGMFRTAKGSFQFDEKSGAVSDVRIEVDTTSVFTNHRKRDDHLKGPDFLNSGEFPRMIFTAAQARRTADRDYTLDGQLELLGKTQPVTMKARWNKSSQYEMSTIFSKAYVTGASVRGSFKRSAFGMRYGLDNGWVGDDVELMIEFEARRQ